MSERRMISRKIVDTDGFMDMPITARLLYYELNWRADDDGFVSSPKKILRSTGCSDDDLKILIAKQFVIPFESGIVLIRDWRIHNYIQKDRYHPTIYGEEKAQVIVENNGMYTKCIQGVHEMDTEVRLGKVRLGKERIEEGDKSPRFLQPSVEDVADYCKERHNNVDAQSFVDFYASKNWMIGKNKMKDWKAAIRTWESRSKPTCSSTIIETSKGVFKI